MPSSFQLWLLFRGYYFAKWRASQQQMLLDQPQFQSVSSLWHRSPAAAHDSMGSGWGFSACFLPKNAAKVGFHESRLFETGRGLISTCFRKFLFPDKLYPTCIYEELSSAVLYSCCNLINMYNPSYVHLYIEKSE
ncbi:hypothetical protein Nepgr_020083 [Nepenthes gracilis]|uniref:Uncharacterized protein n=1 Tax=Nepenthes gracilis TaxID=150966 RepID=A0AAD3SXB8_NEPGR|nr:hypothetical protein Nepgr_020083 [Nepenthes gracilis]